MVSLDILEHLAENINISMCSAVRQHGIFQSFFLIRCTYCFVDTCRLDMLTDVVIKVKWRTHVHVYVDVYVHLHVILQSAVILALHDLPPLLVFTWYSRKASP